MALTFFKKSQSPFILFQEQSDKLIKDINKDLKKCASELKKKSIDEITKKYLGEICQRNLDKLTAEKEKLSELKEENESKPIQKFEIKKEEKLKKLNNLEVQVNDVYSRLRVNDPQTEQEPEKINVNKKDDLHEKQDEDDDDDEEKEEDDDDEEEEDDDDDDDNDKGDIRKSSDRIVQSSKGLKNDNYLMNEDDDDEDGVDDENSDDEKSRTIKSSEGDGNMTTSNKSNEISRKKSVTLITDKTDNDDDDEEEEEDDDDDAAIANETIDLPDGENVFVAIKSFPGQEEGDLSFDKNEKLKVTRIRSDGWMMAENGRGEQGLVPGNFFKKVSEPQDSKDKSGDIDEKEEDVDDDDEEDDDDDGEDDEDEIFSEPNKDTNIVTSEKVQRKKTKKLKGADLWSQLKESVSMSEEKKSELIKSLSSVPSGYREPTLSKLSLKTKFSLKNHMHPCLSVSGLNYKDLMMSSQTNQVEPKKSRIQCIIDLISIRYLPLPTDISVIKILDRHVRVGLFDGKTFFSNFLVIKIPIVEDYNWWKFNSQANSPSSEFSQLFVRSNSLSPELGVLFEITTTLQTEIETIELSCGWSFFKLLTESGLPMSNKTYQLPINGGTPFEKGIPVDKKSDPAKSRKFSFVSVLNSTKDLPILTIKLSSPKKTQNIHMESLPDMVIGQTSNLLYLFLYRQYLLDALIKHRNDLHSIEVLHSPLLASLTEILEQPNLIDVLRASWTEKMKSLSRNEKKNPEVMKSSFLTVFMENVYPLMFLTRLKNMDHHNTLEWKNRKDEVQHFIKSSSGNNLSGLHLFTKPNVPLTPFDTQELTFNLLDI